MSLINLALRGAEQCARRIEQLEDDFADAWRQNAEDLTGMVRGLEPIQSGAMLANTYTQQLGRFQFQTMVDVPYASFVNDGTRHMAPRHFAEQAVAAITPVAVARLEAVVDDAQSSLRTIVTGS